MYEFISGGAMCEVPPSLWLGEGDYQVVKKRALCCSRSACFFCSSESFEKFGLPPEKKLEENSWPDPLASSKDFVTYNRLRPSGPMPLIGGLCHVQRT